jgi:hypothetical protein
MKRSSKYIWYVEASNQEADAKTQAGSAVAVWLRRLTENKGKRYLLTCAHVIRGPAKDGEGGYGPVLPFIWVWEPGSAYSPSERKSASVVSGLAFSADEVPPNMREAHANDWVLLSVDDPSFTENGEALDEWEDPPKWTRSDKEPISIARGIKGIPYNAEIERCSHDPWERRHEAWHEWRWCIRAQWSVLGYPPI